MAFICRGRQLVSGGRSELGPDSEVSVQSYGWQPQILCKSIRHCLLATLHARVTFVARRCFLMQLLSRPANVSLTTWVLLLIRMRFICGICILPLTLLYTSLTTCLIVEGPGASTADGMALRWARNPSNEDAALNHSQVMVLLELCAMCRGSAV